MSLGSALHCRVDEENAHNAKSLEQMEILGSYCSTQLHNIVDNQRFVDQKCHFSVGQGKLLYFGPQRWRMTA
jgi:hypothetical protein